jgi:hypothetical protein
MVGWILAAAGALVLAVGLFLIFRLRSFLAGAVSTQGQVIDLVSSSTSEGGTTHYPRVAFTDADGKRHSFQHEVGSNPPAFEVGESVPVRYDPDDPERAKIAKALSLWTEPVLVAAIGTGLLLAGLVVVATS